MAKRGPEPIIRHSYAPDPNPGKVAAALDLWRTALARKMAQQRDLPPPGGGTPGEGAEG